MIEIKKLEELVQSISIKDISSEQLLIISSKIEECINNIFIEEVESRFIVIIKTKFLNNISEYINILNNQSYSGRSGIQKEANRISNLNLLKALRNKVLNDYREQLINTIHYEQLISEAFNKRDFILNLTDDNGYPTEILPLDIFKELVDKSFEETIIYFKNQSEHENNKRYKGEIFLFADRIKDKISILNKEITILEIMINTGASCDDFTYNNSIEMHNNLYHKEILEKLFVKLKDSHLVLKLHYNDEQISLTVFGHKNYDKLNYFFNELKYFLDITVTFKDIIKVFTHDDSIERKINLTNGTLNDYAYLITALEPYFIESIRNKNYNKWWSERFTFNSVEKNIKALSTMRSNTKRDINRRAPKKEKIQQIVQTIE